MNDVVKFQSTRVAAAFGVEEWWQEGYTSSCIRFHGGIGFLEVDCSISMESGELNMVSVRRPCVMSSQWWLNSYFIIGSPHTHDLMARGLYRLGLDDEPILSQLPSYSAHEKIEMCLSMPREFWPQKWIEELEAVTV